MRLARSFYSCHSTFPFMRVEGQRMSRTLAVTVSGRTTNPWKGFRYTGIFILVCGIQSGWGREIGSAESRIPSIGDRQGNSVGSRYRCGRGSVVRPFGNLGNGIRMVGS